MLGGAGFVCASRQEGIRKIIAATTCKRLFGGADGVKAGFILLTIPLETDSRNRKKLLMLQRQRVIVR